MCAIVVACLLGWTMLPVGVTVSATGLCEELLVGKTFLCEAVA
jgi:hypothetical protein